MTGLWITALLACALIVGCGQGSAPPASLLTVSRIELQAIWLGEPMPTRRPMTDRDSIAGVINLVDTSLSNWTTPLRDDPSPVFEAILYSEAEEVGQLAIGTDFLELRQGRRVLRRGANEAEVTSIMAHLGQPMRLIQVPQSSS